MSLADFDLDVLERVAHDYESISTILGDIARDLQRPVSEQEVEDALLRLVSQGLIDTFVYDPASSRYKKVASGASSVETLWFLINDSGRVVCENAA